MKLKNKLQSKHIYIAFLFISFFLALLFCIFILNLKYFSNDFKGEKDINLTINEIDNGIELKSSLVDSYVKEISFLASTSSENKKEVLLYTVNNDEEEYLKSETIYPTYNGENYFKIDKNVSSIVLKINNLKKEDITIRDFKIHNEFSFNLIAFIFVFLIVFYICYFGRKMILKENISIVKTFVMISLPVGLIYALITPFAYSMDEKEHFARAYNISYFNFNLDKGEEVLWPTDIKLYLEQPYNVFVPTTYSSYKAYINELTNVGNSNYEKKYYASTAEPYLFLAYVISGIGILVGRILLLSLPMQFLLGRLFNLLFFTLVVAMAIKLSGKFKNLVFVVGLIPLVLFQAASYSADMFTNAMCILSFALTIYYGNAKKKIGLTETLILSLCYAFSFLSKIAYFPVCGLIFLIKNEKFNSKSKAFLYKGLLILINLVFFYITYKYASMHGIVQWAVEGVDLKKQVLFILHKPLSYINVLYHTFDLGIFSLLLAGTLQLGYFGDLGYMPLVLLLVIFVISIASTSVKMSIYEKIFIFLVIIGSIVVSMTSLYVSFTPVANTTVLGYQGRYLIPIFLPTLALFTSPKFKVEWQEKTINYFITYGILFLNIFGIFKILIDYYL